MARCNIVENDDFARLYLKFAWQNSEFRAKSRADNPIYRRALRLRCRRPSTKPAETAKKPADAGSGTETRLNPTPSELAASLSPNCAAKLLSDATSPTVRPEKSAPKSCANNWKSPKLTTLPPVKLP